MTILFVSLKVAYSEEILPYRMKKFLPYIIMKPDLKRLGLRCQKLSEHKCEIEVYVC